MIDMHAAFDEVPRDILFHPDLIIFDDIVGKYMHLLDWRSSKICLAFGFALARNKVFAVLDRKKASICFRDAKSLHDTK